MQRKEIQRGDLFYYDFGKREGSVQSGERPVMVIQADNFNANAPTIIVETSDKKANKEIEKAYDLLHSSPSRSVATVKLLEEEIENKVSELEDVVASNNTTAIINVSGEIISLTEERNRKIRISN